MFRKFNISLILNLIVLTWTIVMFSLVWGQLIRPIYVYEGLIRDIRSYFNNTCIILLHSSPNPMETQGLMEVNYLLRLQRYLSSTLYIRTVIIDFHMMATQGRESYNHIKRPLFVLLNDNEDTRDNFANVSKWITMGYPTWLVFFNNKTNLADFFFDVYVPFNCKFMVTQSINETGKESITEVYQVVKGAELRENHFGMWDTERGLQGPPHGLYLRRNNFFGHTLRVASLYDPPVSLFHRNEKNEIIGVNGFFGEIILLLQEQLNCTFTYREAGSWGMCLPNGSCSGAIGMLKNDEIDFAATEFMMTKQRLNYVSFTTPIFSTKVRPYIKRPESTTVIKWDAYVAPFSVNIWRVIGLFIIIMSASIVFIQKFFLSITHLQNNNLSSRFTEITFFITGAFCGQGMDQSTLDPVRMVHLVTYLTAVIILSAYSAALISFLTVKTFTLPFTTMEGLVKDESYGCGVIGNSAYYAFLQHSTDKIMSRVFNEKIEKEKKLPSSYLEGVERVCKEDKYAFVALDSMASLLQQKATCKLEPLDVITPATIAMALQRNSPYRGIINAHILLMKDNGILQRLLQTQWSVQLGTSASSWKSVEMGDIMPLLFLMIIASFVSCLVYITERIIYKGCFKQVKLKKSINDNSSQPGQVKKINQLQDKKIDKSQKEKK
ncbi:probable glutamate receptor [Anoplolepis gracilipes]|uniref:probable glutamate receptor n=1 Tax=Anoplolepis gracilipes TaxID=354296 RepID=UPI003B9F899B